MSSPISLLGQTHVCPVPGHGGGPVVVTQQTYVTVDGIPVATVSDELICTGPPTSDAIATGSSVVKVDGKPVARIGDLCEHGGSLVEGVPWITCE